MRMSSGWMDGSIDSAVDGLVVGTVLYCTVLYCIGCDSMQCSVYLFVY